jgi:hypothetical protein
MRSVSARWRPRSRERDSAGRGSQGVADLGRRVANVPLADAITALALSKVDMDVVLMVAVRAWTEHGRKARADRHSHRDAKVLGDPRVGGAHDPTTLEPDGANVEGVCPPMLAHFGADNAILAAALEGIETLDPGKDGPKDRGSADQILADPIDDRFCLSQRSVAVGEISTERWSLVMTRCSETISGPPHSPGPAIAPREWKIARSGVRRSWQAVGVGGPRGVPPSPAASERGLEGFECGGGTVCAAAHPPVISTTVNTISSFTGP